MERILNAINNYFYIRANRGEQEIKNGKLLVEGVYLENMYIEILGSMVNDGIYKIIKVDNEGLTLDRQIVDEKFRGTILLMKVPFELERIKGKIEEYEAKNVPSAITSESFGGSYSYSKATNKNGGVATWSDVFATDLKSYRNIVSKQGQMRRFFR